MEDIFKLLTTYLAIAIEASAGIIIGVAALEAIVKAVKAFGLCFKQRRTPTALIENIRLHFGRWLSLALEFELAADILRTAMSPRWTEIGELGAIIVLRIILNFFLQLEIDKAANRDSGVVYYSQD